MRRGWAMVDVDGKDSDDDGERDKDHGEDQVLSNEGNSFWRRRDNFLNDQKEDGERHQHWRAERDLLTTIGGQIEDEDGEEGQANAGNDKEQSVEKRQSTDDEEISDSGVGSTVICPQTTAACGLHYLPFTIVKIVLLVHMKVLQNNVHLLHTDNNQCYQS